MVRVSGEYYIYLRNHLDKPQGYNVFPRSKALNKRGEIKKHFQMGDSGMNFDFVLGPLPWARAMFKLSMLHTKNFINKNHDS